MRTRSILLVLLLLAGCAEGAGREESRRGRGGYVGGGVGLNAR